VTRPVVALLAVLAGAPSLPAQPATPPVTLVRLARDTVIDGVTCGPTGRARAEIHGNGRLSECPVARDTTIGGHPFPRGSWPRFTDTGVLLAAWFSRDVTLQGVPCKGAGYKAWSVTFRPGGRLATCYLARAVELDGVPCHAARFWRELTGSTHVVLHPDGRLRSCRLSRAVTIDGTAWRKGQRIVRS
jgi:hypothetical protein